MAASEDRLVENPLFLACTRPAMVLGVPMEALGLILIVCAVVFLVAHSPAWLLLAPALLVVCQAICKSDPNAFRVIWQYLETKGRARNQLAWGGSSFAALPVRRRFTVAEVLHG